MMSFKLARQAILLSGLMLLCPLADAQSYRILVTNDDGIQSPLLATLKAALEELQNVEVVVSAPHENQSGSANSSIGSPLIVDEIYKEGEFFGYAVHGRPADAVTFGVNNLSDSGPFDLLVSGINRGPNMGSVSHASGTVGAAVRAMYLGFPAIAVSQEVAGVDTQASAQLAARLVTKIRQDGAPEGVILSVNIPAGEIQGIQVVPMGEAYLQRSRYEATSQDGNTTTYEAGRIRLQSQQAGTDTFAFQQGYITITPLKFDWTAYEIIPEIESWDLQ